MNIKLHIPNIVYNPTLTVLYTIYPPNTIKKVKANIRKYGENELH